MILRIDSYILILNYHYKKKLYLIFPKRQLWNLNGYAKNIKTNLSLLSA